MLSASWLNPAFSRCCTFSLEILFISGCLDLGEWIRDQKSIKDIGVFIDEHQEPSQSQLRVDQALLQEQNPRRLLNLWFVKGEGLSQRAIYAFPASLRQWSAKPIWDSLQRMDHLKCVWRFKLCLTCLSDEDTLRSMLVSIAQYFPHVSYLEFVVRERNIHLVRVFIIST